MAWCVILTVKPHGMVAESIQFIVTYPLSQGRLLNTVIITLDPSREGIIHPKPWVSVATADELKPLLECAALEPRKILLVSRSSCSRRQITACYKWLTVRRLSMALNRRNGWSMLCSHWMNGSMVELHYLVTLYAILLTYCTRLRLISIFIAGACDGPLPRRRCRASYRGKFLFGQC